MRKLLFILFLATQSWAACPLYTYPENHKLDQELGNLCDNVLNPNINQATIQSATVTSLAISTITSISSATFTNATVKTKLTVPNGSAATDAAAFGQLPAAPVAGQVVGTATNDNATAGNVGEYIQAIAGGTAAAASGNYGDVTSISLTAGDWELTAVNYFNSGTAITVAITGISTTSGNSSTGLVAGSNQVVDVIGATTHDYTEVIPSYRMSLSGTTTVYLKESATYTGSFVCTARLSARRMR